MTDCFIVKTVNSLLHFVYKLHHFVRFNLGTYETGEEVIPDSRLCRLIPCDFFFIVFYFVC